MSTLLEAGFLTVNLQSKFNKQDDANNYAEINNHTTNNVEEQQIVNWGAELEKRLATNKKMSPESRKTDYEIEIEFFKEFFNNSKNSNNENNWDAACAKQLLLIGDQLRKVFKILGFSKKTNPIFAFICDNYVKENLIKTKLLDISTFKVILKALVKKQIASSEFYKANDYNLLYCPAFYEKSIKEMEEYINIQSNILKTSVSSYSNEDLLKNKKTFILIDQINEFDTDKRIPLIQKFDGQLNSINSSTCKLNNVGLAKAVAVSFLGNKLENTNEVELSVENPLFKLKNKTEICAILQFLSSSGNAKAAEALMNDRFNDVSLGAIAVATKKLKDARVFPKGKIQKNSSDMLVQALLNNIKG